MKRLTIVCAFTFIAAGFLLINTRIGVFLVFDILGDVGSDNLVTDPEQGPLRLSRIISPTETINLPDQIEQASGIHVNGDSLFISTDQAEIFELSEQGELLSDGFYLLTGLLLFKQGVLEANIVEANNLFAIGEIGALGHWQLEENQWIRKPDIGLSGTLADREFTGLVRHHGSLYATTDDGLDIVDLDSGELISMDFSGFLKAGRSASELKFSGIGSDDNYLYCLTENYSSLIVFDIKAAVVVETIGLVSAEASDVTIYDDMAYVTVDHNYFDERPPLFVYRLD